MRFRKLTQDEILEFKQAARKKYQPFTPIQGIWHPVYQQECVNINSENATFVDEDRQ